jgi:hypothetical protein
LNTTASDQRLVVPILVIDIFITPFNNL